MTLRVVGAVLAALAVVWLVLHNLEEPVEESFSYVLQTHLESTIGFLVLCGAILILVELAYRIVSRLQR